MQDVTQLTWEDLEETGIVRLGHQKKIMLAIKRVKDVQAGKRFSGHTGQCSAQVCVIFYALRLNMRLNKSLVIRMV